jgi:hypothetical protein
MLSRRQQRKMEASIEAMFSGLDDPILKQTLLTAYAGADPKILEEMQREEKEEMDKILEQMKLQSDEVVSEASVLSEAVVNINNQ